MAWGTFGTKIGYGAATVLFQASGSTTSSGDSGTGESLLGQMDFTSKPAWTKGHSISALLVLPRAAVGCPSPVFSHVTGGKPMFACGFLEQRLIFCWFSFVCFREGRASGCLRVCERVPARVGCGERQEEGEGEAGAHATLSTEPDAQT